MRPGDVVVGVLVGAQKTKVRPAVGIASVVYLAERPDAVIGILTFRSYVLTAHRSEWTAIGHLSGRDWESVKARVRAAFDI